MKKQYRGYANGPFGQIHYTDTVEGTPLLLFHQAPMSLRQFDGVYGGLADRGIRAIGVDLPGFGCSDPTPFVPAIEDYSRITPSVLDHLGVGKCFVLGHHTGSQVATEAAALVPDRISGLILNGPAPFPDEFRKKGLAYVEKHEKGFEAKPDGSHLSRVFQNRMAYANDLTDWDLATRYVAQQLNGLGPFWYGHHAAFQYDHAASIMKIDHPTLILTNTGDEIYSLAQATHRLRPDFSYAELIGGSVDIVDEKPQEWVEAVSDFVLNASLC